jgi:hypothetical protein
MRKFLSSVCYPAILLLMVGMIPSSGFAQPKKSHPHKELYFSWGYNTEWYTRTSLHVSQPSLGNNYTFVNIRGVDHRGWDEGLFHEALSIPQYNYRLGLIFNEKKGLGFEINFDHTKFIFSDQTVHIRGTYNHQPVDSSFYFSPANGFYYFLNNGANFLLFNIVKRWHLYISPGEQLKVDFLGKAGIGPLVPHVQNSLFGHPNDQGFQFGGWNIGTEGCLKATFFNFVYLEFTNKLDYARYSGLQVYGGTAHQNFGCYEWILNLGVDLPFSNSHQRGRL